MVLSDIAPDVRAIADVEAYGAVLRRPQSQLQLVTRHRAGVAAHLLPTSAVPGDFVAADTGDAVVTLSLPGPLDPAHPFVARLRDYRIDQMVLVKMPGHGAVFWAGIAGEGFTASQIERLESLARLTAAAADARQEPLDVRLARLDAIDRVDDMLAVIAATLDIRTVFHRLSALTRAVLPHDGATVQLLDEDHHRARVYALDGITGDRRTNRSRPITPRSFTTISSSSSTTTSWRTRRSVIGRPPGQACGRRSGCR